MTAEQYNEYIRDMENDGWRHWNDHPGYTIMKLGEMLAIHGLKIETINEEDNIWFRICTIPKDH